MLTIDQYRTDVEELMERCRSEGVAMQTIKSLARRRWPAEVEGRFSWYEPLTDPEAIDRAVRFVLAVPDLFLNTTSDARLHPHLFDAVHRFADHPVPPTAAELEADTAAYAITPLFDGGELEVI